MASPGRDLFVTDRSFDWSEVDAASRTLSLFAERRILEIRMPTPRPGKEGGAVLAALAADPGPDNLLLVVTTRPEKDTWSSAWFKAFEKHGVFVQAQPVEIGRLPQWIAARAARVGLEFEPGAAELLAERVEGNLLAAQQEIEKLALLERSGRVDLDAVQVRRRQQRALRRLPARRGRARGRCAARAADPRRPARGGRRAAAGAVGGLPGIARARGPA